MFPKDRNLRRTFALGSREIAEDEKNMTRKCDSKITKNELHASR